MLEPRRTFLITSAVIFSSIVSGAAGVFGQSRRRNLPDRPLPGDPQERDKVADTADPNNSQQTALRHREQVFRAGVEKLYQLSGELREELQTAPASNVLSVKMYKRVQEIEKLAKQMESALKG
jgi:hypothetical protein